MAAAGHQPSAARGGGRSQSSGGEQAQGPRLRKARLRDLRGDGRLARAGPARPSRAAPVLVHWLVPSGLRRLATRAPSRGEWAEPGRGSEAGRGWPRAGGARQGQQPLDVPWQGAAGGGGAGGLAPPAGTGPEPRPGGHLAGERRTGDPIGGQPSAAALGGERDSEGSQGRNLLGGCGIQVWTEGALAAAQLSICSREPRRHRRALSVSREGAEGIWRWGGSVKAGEGKGSYMGRWIRGPGTGDPRDSWKEKREAYGAWRTAGGRWRGVPQPGPLPSPLSPPPGTRGAGEGDSPSARSACSSCIRSCSWRTRASRSRLRASASRSWLWGDGLVRMVAG